MKIERACNTINSNRFEHLLTERLSNAFGRAVHVSGAAAAVSHQKKFISLSDFVSNININNCVTTALQS
ncbi:hypothetical protein EGR_01498 [Echinococcus granulosus]|uniref:Uncharacterized protein n=1 Tax=Echinococcus granulosus TaxID=6210 RepID=W6UQA5_ECHGR|nr:hypothetical protein EGR_01498 [Echinococcus granulosus]EUB63875.1 hypothetical protein EGR_01498 [Echinococcus granulosus]